MDLGKRTMASNTGYKPWITCCSTTGCSTLKLGYEKTKFLKIRASYQQLLYRFIANQI